MVLHVLYSSEILRFFTVIQYSSETMRFCMVLQYSSETMQFCMLLQYSSKTMHFVWSYSTAQRPCNFVQYWYQSAAQRVTLYSTSVQLRDNAIFYGSTVHSDSDFIQYYKQYSSETMRFCKTNCTNNYICTFYNTVQLSSARSGSLTKISIHVYQNSVESFVKQREEVFEVRMYTFIEFFIRLSLGLNSYVHRSTVSAPKSEDEHMRSQMLSISRSFCVVFQYCTV